MRLEIVVSKTYINPIIGEDINRLEWRYPMKDGYKASLKFYEETDNANSIHYDVSIKIVQVMD